MMSGVKFDIRLLGPLEIRRSSHEIALPRSKKTRALLGYLVATGCTHGRPHLCDLLWDGPADPRAALRWSLSKLRTKLEADGATRIITERDRVGFEPCGALVDLFAARASLGNDPAGASTEALEAALVHFRGDFLEGLDLPGCYRFDAWCTAQRESARALRTTVLGLLVERLTGEPQRGLRYARDRLAIDPLAEEAHIAVIRLLARLGSTRDALEQYERCRVLLKRELGARPSRELEALRAAVLPGSSSIARVPIAAPAAASATASGPSAAVPGPQSAVPAPASTAPGPPAPAPGPPVPAPGPPVPAPGPPVPASDTPSASDAPVAASRLPPAGSGPSATAPPAPVGAKGPTAVAGHAVPDPGPPAVAPGPLAAAPGEPLPAGPLPPLVGRAAERAVLEDLLTGTGGRGRDVLLVLGEPGIGKTRLLAEFAAMVRDAGGEVLAGRAFEAEHVRPYGAWLDALRTIPAAEIPAALRAQLATLLPELGPLGASTAESEGRNRLFEAVVQLMLGRAGQGTTAIVLDDLHWADEPSAALLHFVARSTAGSGVLIACAARRAELDDNPGVRSLLRGLRREQRLHTLDLRPLEHADITRLVRGIAPDVDAGAVFADSEGNPLFALELVRARRQGRGELPRTLDGLIGDRLGRLEAEARDLLPWIAALGGGFEVGTLARVTEMPAPALLRGMEELERRGILQPAGGQYDFAHHLLWRVAYDGLSEPRRRLIHTRIARTLSAAGIPDGELAQDLAYHAALAGDDELAARACIIAGWRCLGMFAYSEGAELAARGMTHAARLSEENMLALRLRLLELYVQPGMEPHRPPEFAAVLVQAIADARLANLPATEVSGLYLISVLHYQSGDFGHALENTLRAEAGGRDADPATAVRTIAETARCLGLLECELSRAERLANEAQTLAARLDRDRDFHQIPMALGLLRHHAGVLDEALPFFQRAARLARAEGERWWESACLARLVMVELERGSARNAVERCGDLIDVAHKLGEGSDAPFAQALHALALLSLGDAEAADRLDAAVAGLRRADSQWMIAYVQTFAGAVDLEADRVEAARLRAQQALHAAETVGRPSAVALARALLAQIALASGDAESAASYLGPYGAGQRSGVALPGSGMLSARARAAVETVARQLSKIPT